jgi:integrase
VISQQLQQYDGKLAVCPPKTTHSTRVIALDHTTVAALAEHRDRQRAEAAAYGPGYHASGYVFTNLNGDPMAPDRLTRMFKKLAAQAGLPPVRLHDLRHGAASLALSPGLDLRVVQDMLGHSSIVLTADTIFGAAGRRLQRGGEGRRADHQGRLPSPRHPPPPATPGSAQTPPARKPGRPQLPCPPVAGASGPADRPPAPAPPHPAPMTVRS